MIYAENFLILILIIPPFLKLSCLNALIFCLKPQYSLHLNYCKSPRAILFWLPWSNICFSI